MCAALTTQGGGLQLQLDLRSDYLDKLAVISLCPVHDVSWVTTESKLTLLLFLHFSLSHSKQHRISPLQHTVHCSCRLTEVQ